MKENNPLPIINSPQTTEAQLSTIDDRPKANNFLVILLSILLVISVSISGFFAYQTQKLVAEVAGYREQSKQTQEPITNNLQPSSTPDPTGNWKVYSNSKYNFSFKYPEDWKVTLSPVENEKFNLTADKTNSTNETGFVPVQFSINMSTSDNKITTLSQAETIYKIGSNQTRKDILIDNRPAITITGLVEGPGPGTGRFLSYTFVKLDNEILVIQLGNKEYGTVFDQMLSTLEFKN